MEHHSATATASPNIALIKYWGNRDSELRIPANDSLSITLAGLETKTSVRFLPDLEHDSITINGQRVSNQTQERVSGFLTHIRPSSLHAEIISESNFPTGVGAASSAAGFAALALAASKAAGLALSPRDLSILARKGSGSAARSVFGGVVQLHAGENSEASFAEQIFPAGYWPLLDLIAIVSTDHKPVGSTHGHALAETSPLQSARVAGTPSRLQSVLQAVEAHDFDSLADVCELDSNLMHAVMYTSSPPLLYWTPATVTLMQSISKWRSDGEPVFYTIDAGPNVHCITLPEAAPRIRALLEQIPGTINVFEAGIGDGVRLLT